MQILIGLTIIVLRYVYLIKSSLYKKPWKHYTKSLLFEFIMFQHDSIDGKLLNIIRGEESNVENSGLILIAIEKLLILLFNAIQLC